MEWIPEGNHHPEGIPSIMLPPLGCHICFIILNKTSQWLNIKVLTDHLKPLPVADAGKKTVYCFGWGQGHHRWLMTRTFHARCHQQRQENFHEKLENVYHWSDTVPCELNSIEWWTSVSQSRLTIFTWGITKDIVHSHLFKNDRHKKKKSKEQHKVLGVSTQSGCIGVLWLNEASSRCQ